MGQINYNACDLEPGAFHSRVFLILLFRRLAGPFKELLVRWLRNNYSESTLFKKDSNNKGQNLLKVSI